MSRFVHRSADEDSETGTVSDDAEVENHDDDIEDEEEDEDEDAGYECPRCRGVTPTKGVCRPCKNEKRRLARNAKKKEVVRKETAKEKKRRLLEEELAEISADEDDTNHVAILNRQREDDDDADFVRMKRGIKENRRRLSRTIQDDDDNNINLDENAIYALPEGGGSMPSLYHHELITGHTTTTATREGSDRSRSSHSPSPPPGSVRGLSRQDSTNKMVEWEQAGGSGGPTSGDTFHYNHTRYSVIHLKKAAATIAQCTKDHYSTCLRAGAERSNASNYELFLLGESFPPTLVDPTLGRETQQRWRDQLRNPDDWYVWIAEVKQKKNHIMSKKGNTIQSLLMQPRLYVDMMVEEDEQKKQEASLRRKHTNLIKAPGPCQSLIRGVAATALRRAFVMRLQTDPDKASLNHHFKQVEHPYADMQARLGNDTSKLVQFITKCTDTQTVVFTRQELFDEILDMLPLFDPACLVELTAAMEKRTSASKRQRLSR